MTYQSSQCFWSSFYDDCMIGADQLMNRYVFREFVHMLICFQKHKMQPGDYHASLKSEGGMYFNFCRYVRFHNWAHVGLQHFGCLTLAREWLHMALNPGRGRPTDINQRKKYNQRRFSLFVPSRGTWGFQQFSTLLVVIGGSTLLSV